MGYCFISRSGTVASKKEKVLLAENVEVMLSTIGKDAYKDIVLDESLSKYSEVEIHINGKLGSNGAHVDATAKVTLYIKNAVTGSISTVYEYGDGNIGSEDISGIYSFSVPSSTSNIIRFILYYSNDISRVFYGDSDTKPATVTVYGIPK